MSEATKDAKVVKCGVDQIRVSGLQIPDDVTTRLKEDHGIDATTYEPDNVIAHFARERWGDGELRKRDDGTYEWTKP